MEFLSHLVDSFFSKSDSGATLFRALPRVSPPCLIADQGTEDRIRGFLALWLKVSLVLLPVAILVVNRGAVVVLAACYAWLFVWVDKIRGACPPQEGSATPPLQSLAAQHVKRLVDMHFKNIDLQPVRFVWIPGLPYGADLADLSTESALRRFLSTWYTVFALVALFILAVAAPIPALALIACCCFWLYRRVNSILERAAQKPLGTDLSLAGDTKASSSTNLVTQSGSLQGFIRDVEASRDRLVGRMSKPAVESHLMAIFICLILGGLWIVWLEAHYATSLPSNKVEVQQLAIKIALGSYLLWMFLSQSLRRSFFAMVGAFSCFVLGGWGVLWDGYCGEGGRSVAVGSDCVAIRFNSSYYGFKLSTFFFDSPFVSTVLLGAAIGLCSAAFDNGTED